MTDLRLKVGKDIALAKGERLETYRNKINGEIYYTTNIHGSKFIDGEEFVYVFLRPSYPSQRRTFLMRKANLERVALAST
jgi:hypothetical protein